MEKIYLAMYPYLLQYQAGQIDIVELLTEWERLLGIQDKETSERGEAKKI